MTIAAVAVTYRFVFGGSWELGLLRASIAGILWARFLGMLQGQPLSYMLTLDAILVLYNVAELLGGNGAITILFFGLVLGNMEEIIVKAHRLSWKTEAPCTSHRVISKLPRLARSSEVTAMSSASAT